MTIDETYKELEKIEDEYFSVSYSINKYMSGPVRICKIYLEKCSILEEAPTFQLAFDNVRKRLGLVKPDSLGKEGAE